MLGLGSLTEAVEIIPAKSNWKKPEFVRLNGESKEESLYRHQLFEAHWKLVQDQIHVDLINIGDLGQNESAFDRQDYRIC